MYTTNMSEIANLYLSAWQGISRLKDKIDLEIGLNNTAVIEITTMVLQ